jgi:hypothetical protein
VRRQRRVRLPLSLPLSVLLPLLLAADYDPDSHDWNGLTDLREMLTFDLGYPTQIVTEIDLGQLTPQTPLVLIYPTSDLPVSELMAFVRTGGRLLVADDYGSGLALMLRLGVVSHPGGSRRHRRFLRRNPALPLFSVDPAASPLLEGVNRIVANHPASLSSAEPAVIAYDDSALGLLFDVEVGEGRALVLGDPSLFINFMLEVMDNRALVANLFNALCEGIEDCRPVLATGRSSLGGHVFIESSGSDFMGSLGELFVDSFEAVNDFLGGLSEFRPNPDGIFAASVLLGIGVAVFLFSAMPPVPPRWLSFTFRPMEEMRSRSEFEWQLERLQQAGREADFALPSAILKDEFEDLFMGELSRHVGEMALERRYDPDQLERFAQRFAGRVAGDDSVADRRAAVARARAILNEMAEVPSRKNLVPDVDARYSEGTFRRLYLGARGLLKELGIWERYEQRTGGP